MSQQNVHRCSDSVLSPHICVSHYRKVAEEFHLTSLPIFRAQHYTWHTADPQ